jgi:hypothetical protein
VRPGSEAELKAAAQTMTNIDGWPAPRELARKIGDLHDLPPAFRANFGALFPRFERRRPRLLFELVDPLSGFGREIDLLPPLERALIAGRARVEAHSDHQVEGVSVPARLAAEGLRLVADEADVLDAAIGVTVSMTARVPSASPATTRTVALPSLLLAVGMRAPGTSW